MNELQLRELLLAIRALAKVPMYRPDKLAISPRAGRMTHALGSIVGLCSTAIKGEPVPPYRAELEDHRKPQSTASLPEAVDLVQVVEDVGWRGLRIDNSKASPAAVPALAGTFVGLSPREALLWTHANAEVISGRGGSYFQGAPSTPRPVRLVRHAGHGPWDDSARAVLALSKGKRHSLCFLMTVGST